MTRVLFPLDGSERSLKAMERALDLLAGRPVQATVLVVRQKGFEGAPEDMVQMFEEDADDEIFPTEDSALQVLRAATRRCRKDGVRLSLKTVEGSVWEEVVRESADHDLLVIHGVVGEKGGLLASRAEKIARRARCEVLLVNA